MRRKQITQKMLCTREISGEYVSAGDVYTVTRYVPATPRADAHFWCDARNCGTMIREWRLTDALRSGALVIQ